MNLSRDVYNLTTSRRIDNFSASMHNRTETRKTVMSILQDLDPKYAKIHRQPSTAWKPALGAGLLLLAAGSSYWLLTNNQTQPPSPQNLPFTTPEKAMGAENSRNSPAPQAATAMAPDNASATIRDEAKPTRQVERETTVGPVATEYSTDSLAHVEYRGKAPSQPEVASTPQGHAPTKNKTERRIAPGQASAKNEKNQPETRKRANERDVDIITAIVR